MKNIIAAPANMSAHINEVLSGEYDIPELKFKNPPVILDIGANVGAFAVWASERFPDASILCYEPSPRNLELLEGNTVGIATIVPFAVSNHNGESVLYDGKFNCGESSLTDVRASLDTGILVKVISGEYLPPADIIKLDTEGSEWEILSTYQYLDKVTAIMFEWHRPEDRDKIAELLTSHGFNCVADHRTQYVDRGVQKWAKGLPEIRQDGVPASQVNLLIGCPCYGGLMYASHATSAMALILELNKMQVRHTLEYLPNESLIPRARNRFGTMCLLGDREGKPFTHLLFLDVDIGFKARDIISLIALDKDIVALPYSAKDFDWAKIVKAVKAGVTDGETLRRCAGRPIINCTEAATFSVNEPVQFPQLGTGILLIKRKVFEKMAEADSLSNMGAADFERSDEWLSYKNTLRGLSDHRDFAEQYAKFLATHPRRKYKLMQNENAAELGSDFAYDFFQIGINEETRFFDSEDFRFCLDARKLGFETWLWPNGTTTHTGPYSFALDIPTQAALGIDLTANPAEDLVAK